MSLFQGCPYRGGVLIAGFDRTTIILLCISTAIVCVFSVCLFFTFLYSQAQEKDVRIARKTEKSGTERRCE